MTYYVLMDNEKIRHYRGSLEYLKLDCENNNIPFDEKNVIEVEEEPILYKGELYFKNDIPENDVIKEKQRSKRAQAYLLEKDPITCQIQSLKDEEQTPEIIEEIESLKLKRAEIVSEIKERYPYPEEEV